MKILIAGGSGLVGTNLTNMINKKKYKIVSSYFTNIQNKQLQRYYKRFDFTKLNECIKATKNMDCVIICAVVSGGIKILKKNDFFNQTLQNINMRSNLFEACRINNIKNIIWISSSTVYQPANYSIKENQLDINLEPYTIYQSVGWGYRYIEKLAKYYNENHNMHIKILRTTSIYGPYDNFNEEKSHVMPALIKRALSKENPFIVWGDKNVVRDFIYVEDLVKAVIKLINIKNLNQPINFSSSKGTSINILSNKILKICNINSKIVFNKSKPSSASYRVLNNVLANKILKIKKRTTLENGIKKTVRWFKNSL